VRRYNAALIYFGQKLNPKLAYSAIVNLVKFTNVAVFLQHTQHFVRELACRNYNTFLLSTRLVVVNGSEKV
jgi:hypothetical protein